MRGRYIKCQWRLALTFRTLEMAVTRVWFRVGVKAYQGLDLQAGDAAMTSNVTKRTFDVLVSSLALIALSPTLVAIAVAVYAKLGAPIFFRQERAGLRGQPFRIIKFRTMTTARGADGSLLPDERRLTPLGSFLRETSLDETPELWNVLSGDMSLVGPRPLHVRYLERYSPEHARRHNVSPGLTGWAQIHGRNALSWEEKFALDVWYVDNRNLLLDIWILIRTIGIVLSRRGVTPDGASSTPDFQGSNAHDTSRSR